jgi:hypothetical protein
MIGKESLGQRSLPTLFAVALNNEVVLLGSFEGRQDRDGSSRRQEVKRD